MEIPERLHETTQRPEITASTATKRRVIGATSLALLGLVSFSFVASFAQIQSAAPPRALATAAAGIATEKTVASEALAHLSLSARGAYVFDIDSGEMLYEKNANVQLPLASITKVPLVLAVSDALREGTVTISREAVQRGQGGGLGTGEIWLPQDLIDFTLIASSNAGAEALAEAAGAALRIAYPEAPERDVALWRMNAIARELGLTTVYFLNPSGLDESRTQPGSAGSARDVAYLVAYAAREKGARFAGTTRSQATLTPLNAAPKIVQNTNEALTDIPGLILGKTGYTDLAGGNLAVVFQTDNRRIAAVVLGSSYEGRFDDIRALVQAAGARGGGVQ